MTGMWLCDHGNILMFRFLQMCAWALVPQSPILWVKLTDARKACDCTTAVILMFEDLKCKTLDALITGIIVVNRASPGRASTLPWSRGSSEWFYFSYEAQDDRRPDRQHSGTTTSPVDDSIQARRQQPAAVSGVFWAGLLGHLGPSLAALFATSKSTSRPSSSTTSTSLTTELKYDIDIDLTSEIKHDFDTELQRASRPVPWESTLARRVIVRPMSDTKLTDATRNVSKYMCVGSSTSESDPLREANKRLLTVLFLQLRRHLLLSLTLSLFSVLSASYNISSTATPLGRLDIFPSVLVSSLQLEPLHWYGVVLLVVLIDAARVSSDGPSAVFFQMCERVSGKLKMIDALITTVEYDDDSDRRPQSSTTSTPDGGHLWGVLTRWVSGYAGFLGLLVLVVSCSAGSRDTTDDTDTDTNTDNASNTTSTPGFKSFKTGPLVRR
ncbi:uncharacterized protein STEHIDRAFT_158738 [Stereum hirsutum FP-91666 SS1]|uniref:uncharacterized protein n=1 Tax=Stereum hirsutum (strain FP-91666) TaxID=721885 RepID=UPI000444925A|nr:uncharacterized protein STEHIDRAFT_158738 [Stereum hirsutum FP-91666 SS1]EIM85042.1 hypothetical protein STEHIDRAFT_158738 [Stereum hirsutum FP-91666 SS1]